MTSLPHVEHAAGCGMGDRVGDGLHPLDAKRTGSKGYGVSMADASSAMRLGTVAAGAPQRPRPGTHPFWPGDRAMHGTVSPPVAQEKYPLNSSAQNAFRKKSGIEIDARGVALAAGERKPLWATPMWYGSFPPLNWPRQPPQNRFYGG